MKLAEMTKQAIMIRDPNERETQIDDLSWLFEGGFTQEDVIEAASLLLFATREEKEEEIKAAMFFAVSIASRYYDISAVLKWHLVVEQLPDLSGESIVNALDLLGFSKSLAYIPIVKPYAYDDRVSVQLSALSSLARICWEVSGQDPALDALMHVEEQGQISYLLLNPNRHDVPFPQIKAQVQRLRDKIIENLETWLEQRG